jgi:hypothetical protein
MSADPGIVIIGASLAGAKAAQALRLDHGYDGPITLVGDEPHLPYERPALSKGYLIGTTEISELDVLEPQFYSDQDITLALLTGLRPSPTSHAAPTFPYQGASSRRDLRSERRPPPLATPKDGDRDAKCVCAGQVRCRCAVERARSTATPSSPPRQLQT